MINQLKNESGYSLVEVMASIMILAIAIIPMVGMFDAALRSVTLGGNYDTARAFAHKQLERAEALPYETVKKNFPFNAPTAAAITEGSYTSSAPITSGSTPHEVPQDFSYTVVKRYKAVPTTGNTVDLANSTTDQGIIEIKVTVQWGENSTFTVTGLKAR